IALGGEAGARLVARLGLRTSPDTLLRLVQMAPAPDAPAPQVLGVDEWAWRRGQRYGTILVNLEDHRVMDLLPERSAESVAAWLGRADVPGAAPLLTRRAAAAGGGATATACRLGYDL